MNSAHSIPPGTLDTLKVSQHDRDLAGLTYVYPVLSRRAGGVSVGINLNPNNACNWHCAYCQVPDLVRGKAPDIDLLLLEHELSGFLADLIHGDWMERFVPEGSRVIRDIAFSGNGEPTSAEVFAEAVDRVLRVRDAFGLAADAVPVRLIDQRQSAGTGAGSGRRAQAGRRWRGGVVQGRRGYDCRNRTHQRGAPWTCSRGTESGTVRGTLPDLGADLRVPLGRCSA